MESEEHQLFQFNLNQKFFEELNAILKFNLDVELYNWLSKEIVQIRESKSARDLFMTYSILGTRLDSPKTLNFSNQNNAISQYLSLKNANELEMARLLLLVGLLENDTEYFKTKAASIIQIADTSELVSFLKYLILLPEAENFKSVAVDALRTNVSRVFDSIAMENPYPAKYFSNAQWNQLYLKAAFMDRDLTKIWNLDKMANSELARIISDYAHERWSASREVNPYFWRPVAQYLDDVLLLDMQRLLESENIKENKAAILCCEASSNPQAKELLKKYTNVSKESTEKVFNWYTL